MGMNPWVKRKWVRALRSGEYKQGQEELIVGEWKSYCCLGVLAAEMVPEYIRPVDKGSRALGVDGYTGALPDDLAVMFGLDEDSQDTLANKNDDGESFCQIADWIEEKL